MKNYIVLGFIILLATILRLWNLGIVPPGPNWDEAALGYNAYSILKTGRDEYGNWFPLSLRSYDDYKPPLYMYLTVPSVWMFGLDIWSVRLPAVVMGVLAVIGTYFLTKELVSYFSKSTKFQYLPFIVSLLLAISPWHLQFSRMAFEAGIGLTVTIWAVVSFLWGLKKGIFFSLSAFLFSLSIYAYHSQRIFSPLLVIVLGCVFFNMVIKKWKSVLIAAVVGLLTIGPLIPVLTDSSTLTRLRGTSALADQTRLLERSVIKLERNQTTNNLLGKILDNRRIVFAQTLLSGYLSSFSLNWLFLTGDNPRHHAPGMGLLYHIELPFLFIGLFFLIRYGRQAGKLVLAWMLIAPIAASPTTELPHAIRTLVFLPTFQIVIGLGILHFLVYISTFRKYVTAFVLAVFIGSYLFNVSYYLVMYFVHQNKEFSNFWQYGYKEAIPFVMERYDDYDKIVVSTKLEQPHMFFLFYLKYDPKKYLEEGGTVSGSFAERFNKFDKFEFRTLQWDKEKRDKKTLYLGAPIEMNEGTLKTVYYLDGTVAMLISH